MVGWTGGYLDFDDPSIGMVHVRLLFRNHSHSFQQILFKVFVVKVWVNIGQNELIPSFEPQVQVLTVS